jgi:hypothetical protein
MRPSGSKFEAGIARAVCCVGGFSKSIIEDYHDFLFLRMICRAGRAAIAKARSERKRRRANDANYLFGGHIRLSLSNCCAVLSLRYSAARDSVTLMRL